MSMGNAIVTGGASGLGEACARKFAADGHHVWILDINADLADEVVASIKRDGGKASALSLNVSDEKAMEAAAERIAKDGGAPDILVTSAGILHSADTVLDMDMEQHDKLWDINYRGTLLACRAFGRQMLAAEKGSIVTLGSINSMVPMPLPAYSPSKTAIMRLTEILAVELGRKGVRVNSIAPTYILTPALKARIAAGERDADLIRKAGAIEMYVTPEQVAGVVAFLCSETAAAITGVMLPVDAGYLAAVPYRSYAGGVPWAE